MAPTVKGTANAAATTTTVTIPSHAVGDLIQLFVYRDGSTAIATKPTAAGTVPAWVDIDAPTGANTNACATYWFIATATNHTSGTWTGVTGMTAVVITGHDPTTPIGGHAVGGSTGTNTAQAPAITLTKTDGTSLILEHYGHRTVTAWSAAPAGYTRQASAATEVCLNTKDSSTTDGAISQTCTASSSGYRGATVEILAAPTPGPKLATLTANFDSGIGSDFVDQSGTTSASGGLRIDHAATAYGIIDTYPGANSAIAYDLTGSYGYVQAADLGNTALTSHDVVYGLSVDANNWLMFFTEATTLYAARMVAGSQTAVATAAFNATNHRWWKIREASGTVFWDVSADGVTWSNFGSLANPFAVTNLFAKFRCGIWQAEASGSYCVFDNFNTTGAASASVTVTDTAQGVDTAAAVADLARTVTDSGQGVDAASATQNLARTAADAAAGVDSASAAQDSVRTATDSGQGTDSASTTQALVRTTTDQAQGVDSASAVLATGTVTVSDQSQGVDTAAVISDLTRTVTDSGQGVDTGASALSLVRAVTDTAQGTDAAAAVSDLARPVTDQAQGVDAASVAQDFVRTTTDQGQVADTAAVVAALVRTVTDTGPGVDSASVVLAAAGTVTVTDSGQGVDAASAVQALARTTTDVGQGTDVGSASLQRTTTVTDVAAGVDTARVVSDLVRTATDQAQGVDSASQVSAATAATVTDAAQGVDTSRAVQSLVRTVTDTARGVDTAQAFTIGTEAPTPVPGRILKPQPESRTCTPLAESRTCTAAVEVRTIKPDPQSRICVVTAENRTVPALV